MIRTDYTREELIDICERAIVSESDWGDRDSHQAQMQVGSCWALLKAGCEFKVITEGSLRSDDRTIWVEIRSAGFSFFEYAEEDNAKESANYYLPNPDRLLQGGDWY